MAATGVVPNRVGPVQRTLYALAWLVAGLLLVLPLATVFTEALRAGFGVAVASLAEPDAMAAIRLTLLVTAIAVPVNTVGALAAAWCLTKFRFRGRATLLVLIELPLTISPVVSGLVWLLLFGARGWFAPLMYYWGVQIVFATPGIVLATIFVTFPLVLRTLVPLMDAQGNTAEEAATMLGAGFIQMFARITLPDIRWALLSGVLLCTARAMGEFGAVSVVSGHVPGLTETIPLRVEALYDGYETAAAFAMAALLSLFGLVSLVIKGVLEARMDRDGSAAT
jgi:sulfate transport system permease protein